VEVSDVSGFEKEQLRYSRNFQIIFGPFYTDLTDGNKLLCTRFIGVIKIFPIFSKGRRVEITISCNFNLPRTPVIGFRLHRFCGRRMLMVYYWFDYFWQQAVAAV